MRTLKRREYHSRRGATGVRLPAVDNLPSKSRPKRQARIERRQLRKLKSTGLFKGKIDLRKPPTPAAKRALRRFRAVIEGKAKVLKPKSPKSYRKVFRVVGNKVIVPRRKGERLYVRKDGKIVTQRKIAGQSQTGVYKKLDEITEEKRMYILPLNRGHKGLEFYKFNSKEELEKFVYETSPKVGETFKRYADYVIEVDPGNVPVISEEEGYGEKDYFEEILRQKLNARHAARRGKARRKK